MGSHLKGQHGDDRACTAKQRPLAAAPEPPSPVNVPYSGFYLNGSELTALKCKNMVSTSEDVISDLEAISQGKVLSPSIPIESILSPSTWKVHFSELLHPYPLTSGRLHHFSEQSCR